MSYDLTIWKWAANTSAGPDEILDAIGNDQAHPAMQRFDMQTFVNALYAEFGGKELWSGDKAEPPFIFDVADFTGTPANW